MFDRLVVRPRSRRSWPTLILSASVIAHVVLGATLLMIGMWQIQKLTPPSRQVTMVAMATPPRVELDDPPPPKKARQREPVRDSNAPAQRVPGTAEPEAQASAEVEIDLGHDQGDMLGVDGGRGNNTISLNIGGEGPALWALPEMPTMPKPEPRAAPKIIPAELLDGKRIAGDEQILPPDAVRVLMLRHDKRQVQGTIKMCLDNTGQVESLALLVSTGYAAYDDALLSAMRSWRYEPYRVNGDVIPVCSAITFVYVMKD